jgi:hypothetical protein
MANNPKHIFDFEGIINMNVDQKAWKDLKKKLHDGFGQLKIAIDDGMTEEEAKRQVELLNKVFEKAKMPTIKVDDLKNSFDQIARSFEQALAALNNIDTSALKGIETSLDHISDQVDQIVDKIGNGVKKSVNGAVASVKMLDKALGSLGDPRKQISEALNFSNDGSGKARINVVKKLKEEYMDFAKAQIKAQKAGEPEDPMNWFKRQEAMVKYVRAYEDYYNGLKDKKDVHKDYRALYDALIPKSFDAKINLQNLSDRRSGTYSEATEPWAREDTLKEVRDILKGGIKVSGDDKSGDAKKNKEPEPGPKKKRNNYIYRGIFPPEYDDSSLTREDMKRQGGGGEWWTNKKDVAQTYADMDKGGAILVGTISPKNPLIIDAGGKQFDKFDEMPGFQSEEFQKNFSDIIDKIKQVKEYLLQKTK